jgi:hypothetical protein
VRLVGLSGAARGRAERPTKGVGVFVLYFKEKRPGSVHSKSYTPAVGGTVGFSIGRVRKASRLRTCTKENERNRLYLLISVLNITEPDGRQQVALLSQKNGVVLAIVARLQRSMMGVDVVNQIMCDT